MMDGSDQLEQYSRLNMSQRVNVAGSSDPFLPMQRKAVRQITKLRNSSSDLRNNTAVVAVNGQHKDCGGSFPLQNSSDVQWNLSLFGTLRLISIYWQQRAQLADLVWK